MATPAAASDWIRYWDEASSDYYYHRPATGETSWEQPDRWICGEGYDSPEDSARRSRAGSSLPLEDEDDVDAPEEDLFVVRASLSGPPPLPAGGPPPFSFGAPPPLPVPATEPSSPQREERRRRVLGEILSTERTYVAALQTLDKVYMVPMRMVADAGAKVAIFSHADLDTVFLNLDVLLKLHTRFLERLEQEEASGHFGAILSGAAKDIKGCYTRYISNYAQAEAHISALASKAPDKHRYLEVCKSHPDAGGLDVRSFLIQPIQRVPRYRLLLEELIAHTEPGHPDEADLREALTRIREVAAFINEETRVSATLCKLREVARRFAQPEVLEKSLVRQGRAFVREGELTKVRLAHRQRRKVFLFSDLLVYGVPTGRGYVQKGQIPLGEGTRVERLPRTEHLTHGFAVVDGHGKGYTWHGESEAETGEWFEEVQRAVRACQPERRPSSFDAVAALCRAGCGRRHRAPSVPESRCMPVGCDPCYGGAEDGARALHGG